MPLEGVGSPTRPRHKSSVRQPAHTGQPGRPVSTRHAPPSVRPQNKKRLIATFRKSPGRQPDRFIKNIYPGSIVRSSRQHSTHHKHDRRWDAVSIPAELGSDPPLKHAQFQMPLWHVIGAGENGIFLGSDPEQSGTWRLRRVATACKLGPSSLRDELQRLLMMLNLLQGDLSQSRGQENVGCVSPSPNPWPLKTTAGNEEGRVPKNTVGPILWADIYCWTSDAKHHKHYVRKQTITCT